MIIRIMHKETKKILSVGIVDNDASELKRREFARWLADSAKGGPSLDDVYAIEMDGNLRVLFKYDLR